MRTESVALVALAIATNAVATESLAYSGIGLATMMTALKTQFPNSRADGDALEVDERDSRDHIYGVQLIGRGKSRVVRIGFARPSGGESRKQPRFPKCKVVEAAVRAKHGAPDEVRKFSEEATQRADRIWKSSGETLTLRCFVGPGTELLAEGVLIAAR